MNTTAIPTRYKGILFRSRLEARWSAFFDLLGWPYAYEPIDLRGYILDFILLFKEPVLVEVKPELYFKELAQHEAKLEASGWEKGILIVGATLFKSTYWGGEVIGSFGEPLSNYQDGTGLHNFDEAIMICCGECGRPSFIHSSGWWSCPVCGVGLGKEWSPHSYLPSWNLAGEQSQWHPDKRKENSNELASIDKAKSSFNPNQPTNKT